MSRSSDVAEWCFAAAPWPVGEAKGAFPALSRGRCTKVGFQVFAAKKCRDALPGIPNPSILVGYNLSRTKLYTSVG